VPPRPRRSRGPEGSAQDGLIRPHRSAGTGRVSGAYLALRRALLEQRLAVVQLDQRGTALAVFQPHAQLRQHVVAQLVAQREQLLLGGIVAGQAPHVVAEDGERLQVGQHALLQLLGVR